MKLFKCILFIFVLLFALSFVWGGIKQRNYSEKKELVTLAIALRNQYYSHLSKFEVEVMMTFDDDFLDNQHYLYQGWRVKPDDLIELHHIKRVALAVQNRTVDELQGGFKTQAEWLMINYSRIVCDSTLRLQRDLDL